MAFSGQAFMQGASKTGFAGDSCIESLIHSDRANARFKWVEDFFFLKRASVLADVTAHTFLVVALDMLVNHV